MDLDAGFFVALGVAIAGDVGALVDDMDRVAFFRELPGDNCPAKAGSDA